MSELDGSSAFASRTVLRVLLAIYAAARVTQILPNMVPMPVVVALHVFTPLVFALWHGAAVYKLRGMMTFIGICLVVGNAFENLSILTGFPFGDYYFTTLMGPKIFLVPVMLGLAYVGTAYLSWVLAELILGCERQALSGARLIILPLTASFLMVVWDFSQEPVWATILRAWVWRDGGAYFGVPFSNFLGWCLVMYVMYQIFALYVRGRRAEVRELPTGYWRLAVFFYGVSAAGNVLLMVPVGGPTVVTDPVGVQWKVSTITTASALVSIFAMGAFALFAWARTVARGEMRDS
jgi:uncharacterized membrane protein